MTREELMKLLAVFDVYIDESVVDNRKNIIESISKMDTQALNNLLKDEFTYSDVSKVDFLNILNTYFNQFKKDGNSYLEVHKGSCMSNYCDAKDDMALSFVCNKTRDALNLIFKESNHEFFDIFECHNFKLCNKNIVIKPAPNMDDFGLTQEDIDNLPF